MSVKFRFPDYSWLVEAVELGQFLDLAFANDHGEVWLFNNDLQMILQHDAFYDLYLTRVANTLRNQITAVKILVRPELVDQATGLEASLKGNRTLCERLAEIARRRGGRHRLSTFYFGVADRDAMPEAMRRNGGSDDSWIFYAQRSTLESGIVMLRHRHFPFHVPGEKRHFAIVWMLQHYPLLRSHLKDAFVSCFKAEHQFKRMKVTSTDPFDFKLVDAASDGEVTDGDVASPPASAKKPLRPKRTPNSAPSVSLGDQIDVALLTALPEEMAELKAVIAPAKARSIPLLDDYEYVVIEAKTGPKRILLTTIIDQGTVPAAIRTWDMIQKWQPRHVMLVGVAGGDPEDKSQSLGDVIIGNWVIGYERGKMTQGVFKKENSRYTADEVLLKAATQLKNGKSWPRRIKGMSRPSGSQSSMCKVHDDLAVGSGSKLVADATFFKELQDINRKIKAVEMEADGVACACDKFGGARVKVLVIKGIMDKSNPETRDMNPPLKHKWMLYAARAAAEFAVEIIRSI